jgi:proline iminopeptidase
MKGALLFTSFLIFFACHDDVYDQGDFFFLTNKNAQMPVNVRGNKGSGVFIVFLHGGPGGSALQKVGLPVFNTLEKEYATVFWDQRSSGSSQGNSPDNLLTLDQFVEDLDKLIDVLQYKYGHPKIFLLGHSWGGCLGTAYLLDSKRQSKISGWMEVDGAHDNPKGDSLSLQWVTDYARLQISQDTDVSFWQYALRWYAENPNFTSNQLEHYAFLERAHGYIHDPTIRRDPLTFPEFSADYLFASPTNIPAEFTNYNHVIKKFIISDIDLTPEMKKITLPSIIYWGKNDGVIPYPMASQALQALGTPDENKSIVTLPTSAHFSFYEEPGLFDETMRGFIEKYK